MIVSIVIPVYNEERTITEILERAINADVCGLEKEIIVVDDGSTDNTVFSLQQAKQKWDGLKVFYHNSNKGKAEALKTGFSLAHGDIFIIQDADLEYDPSDYPKLLEPIVSGRADVVFGSRFYSRKRPQGMPLIRYFCNRFLSFLCNIIYHINISDMETGYKVFTRKVLEEIKISSDRFDFEPEFTIQVARKKFRIAEVGINYNYRTFSEGKKITFFDGISAIFTIVKMRFRR